uniref:Taste receptor type 2 n=1 Tax=Zonotrichia albicollis TaxID=44394 RepID=D5XMA7_ZONAL|nr:taste receptor, type 2, member 10 [Zonotrichia albicollis]ADD70299.1 taste receptor, type 2, member 10 [Zonotrichia albicollis]
MAVSQSPQQSNVTSYWAIIVAISTLEAFAGMWINAFLVCVLCIAWVKKKTLNSNEKILLMLGSSRISSLCLSYLYYCIARIYPNYFYVYPILQLFAFFAAVFNYSNLWVSACLSGFYCVKIANFRNSFFIYLKVKIDRMVPWLLLGSELLALAMAFVFYDINEILLKNITSTSQENFWEVPVRKDKHLFSSFFLIGFGYAASFLAVIFSAVFLLFSLWRHKRTMQTSSMKDLSMDAHIRAMKSVLSFLVMYSINFVCLVLTIIYAMKKENVMTLLIYIYLYAFPGVHSLTVIFSNPKLEKALLKILSCVKWEVFFK